MGDGSGSWTLTSILNSSAISMNGDGQDEVGSPACGERELERVLEEIRTLEGKLEEARGWESRLEELKKR